jgi:hypothetical protein
MKSEMKGLSVGVLCALLLGAASAAGAQDNAIGNPALRDFQLHPRQPQPQEQPQGPVVTPAPPPAARPQPAPPAAQPPAQQQQPQAQQPQPQAQQPRSNTAPPAARPQAPAQTQTRPVAPAPAQPQAQPQAATPTPENAPPPAAEAPAPAVPAPLPPAATPPAETTGPAIPWRYLLPAAALALIGLALLLRRRWRGAEAESWADEAEAEAPVAVAAEPAAAPVAAPAAVAEPAPDPTLRPWLELSLKAERAQTTATETLVNFELEIANTGKTAARNLRIDVKMFNAGAEQDSEIGAFFRTAGRESTKLSLPGIPAETTGVINGSVTMAREDMRAVVLEDKYLFVPVIAVNALYDWGEGRSGQTSKSYVVGRELQQPGEKMGAFRVDQGPRVWRTVGQRQHKLARRV